MGIEVSREFFSANVSEVLRWAEKGAVVITDKGKSIVIIMVPGEDTDAG